MIARKKLPRIIYRPGLPGEFFSGLQAMLSLNVQDRQATPGGCRTQFACEES
jgi:hypothetical protein